MDVTEELLQEIIDAIDNHDTAALVFRKYLMQADRAYAEERQRFLKAERLRFAHQQEFGPGGSGGNARQRAERAAKQ